MRSGVPVDGVARPEIIEVLHAHAGRRPVETVRFVPPGGAVQRRDVVRAGKVAAVIAYDPALDAIVMLRQFRLAAHLANGRGMLVEVVAGRVETGEEVIDAARRECREEIGLEVEALTPLFSYLTTPGYSDEEVTVFLGRVDARAAPGRAGIAEEGETTEPFAVDREAAVAALDAGTVHNGIAIAALGWVARHGDRMAGLLAAE